MAWLYNKIHIFSSVMGKSVSSKNMTELEIPVVINFQLPKMLRK